MNQREEDFERNLEQWIRASCGPDTRPGPLARERLREQLALAWIEKRRREEFPAGILALFSGIVLLLAVLILPSLSHISAGSAPRFEVNPAGLLVLANLAFLPIACLVIILRRKSCPNA